MLHCTPYPLGSVGGWDQFIQTQTVWSGDEAIALGGDAAE